MCLEVFLVFVSFPTLWTFKRPVVRMYTLVNGKHIWSWKHLFTNVTRKALVSSTVSLFHVVIIAEFGWKPFEADFTREENSSFCFENVKASSRVKSLVSGDRKLKRRLFNLRDFRCTTMQRIIWNNGFIAWSCPEFLGIPYKDRKTVQKSVISNYRCQRTLIPISKGVLL